MHDLKGYSDDYLKTSGSLWQYYKDAQPLNKVAAIADFTDNNIGVSLTFEGKMTDQKGNYGTSNLGKMVPLKYSLRN